MSVYKEVSTSAGGSERAIAVVMADRIEFCRHRCSRKIALVASTLLFAAAGHSQTLPPETHPSLLFTAAELPLLKSRIERAPYSSWWQTTLQRAQTVPDAVTVERSKARYAKSLAFAYLMTDDETFAQRGLELLLDMRFPPRGGDLGEPHNEGEVVAQYAQAYDMLHEFVSADATSLAAVRALLAEEAARLMKGIVVQEINLGFVTIKLRLHETPHIDNWHLRAYGGLGFAALVLADHPGVDDKTPQDWSDRALDLSRRTLEYQIDAVDGGYAEGPFYSRYAADVYLPYLIAMKRLTGLDLIDAPIVRKMHDWSVNIRMPNGRRPNIDDGHLDDFYGHYLAAVDDDGPVHLWDWQNNETGLYVREFSELDAIALYDDRIEPQEPTRGPTIFMPEAGDAVFRNDWSSDGIYMLLRGEHGLVRNRGLAHEHADETSFIIYAFGEMLAVDAGYINFTNHHKVNAGRSHNVILVDGEGPPLFVDPLIGESIGGGNNAFIEEFFSTEHLDYAEVRAQYGGVDLRRRVMFSGKRYFVVADEVRDLEVHQYEWRLHGNAGGNTGADYSRAGPLARWVRPDAQLVAYVVPQQDLTLAEADTIHSFTFSQEETHTFLQAQTTGSNVEFLSVLFPSASGMPVPSFEVGSASGAQAVHIEGGGFRDLAWVAEHGADSILVEDQNGNVRTDARFGQLRYEGDLLRSYTIQDASFLRIGGEDVFSAGDTVDLSLSFEDGGLQGFAAAADGGTEILIPLSATALDSLRFDGALLDSSLAADQLRLTIAGAGALVVRPQPAQPETGEGGSRGEAAAEDEAGSDSAPGDFDRNGLVDLEDFSLFAQAYDSESTPPTAVFDLNGDGRIDFADFFLFADLFPQSAPQP